KTRSVPACHVPSLSDTLAGLLGLRRGSEVLEDVVPTDSTEEKQSDTVKGQKRKLEEMSDEASDASPLILQPLKVKKIIPNPTKIRKRKESKSAHRPFKMCSMNAGYYIVCLDKCGLSIFIFS
ncbi:ribonuclease P protein subunit p38-like, partial [Sinocyclocheilus grahami]|uniref:ribonuclease P protein subunit p38-like n=1 Tax=Sinocyclocheilus grahami TaxID=75366 RepID=UPI0007AD40DE